MEGLFPESMYEIMLGIALGAVVLIVWEVIQKKRTRLEDIPSSRTYVPRGYTAEELKQYNGVDNESIFIGVKGIIYAVAPQWYGVGSPYNAFAGQEASRQLGKVVVGTDECNADWTTLSAEHLRSLQEWEERFKAKYCPVGWFIPDADYTLRAASMAP